ncbi:MAG: MFS transporter, partial [Proteobacteria bacterium]
EPILDFSLFKIRTFAAANLANFLNFVAYSSLLVLMPFYLEEVLELSPEQAGVLMSAIPLTVFIIAPISGYLADKFGTRGLSVMGGCVSSTVLLAMAGLFGSGLDEKTLHPYVLVGLCMVGMASGLFQSPNNVALMSSIPLDKLGVASALMATIRNLGLVTGTGLAAKVFSWKHAATGDFVKAFHASLFVAGFMSLGVIGASLMNQVRSTHSPWMKNSRKESGPYFSEA